MLHREVDYLRTAEEITALIKQSTGTGQYHKYAPFSSYPVITDGVKAIMEAADCAWFLDIIGSWQTRSKKLDPHFQVWTLKVKDDGSAVVRGYNDTERIITQKVKMTDFPLPDFKVYLIDGVILLPNEY